LLDADEAFLTGTAIEITPIREIDGRAIGDGARGSVTEAIPENILRRRRRTKAGISAVAASCGNEKNLASS